MTVSDLINGMLREDGGFQKAFRSILDDELNMSLNEFCQLSGISQSTMYKILEDKKAGRPSDVDFVEIMACRGGCIAGGGQPYGTDDDVRKERTEGLYEDDEKSVKRCSHQNPSIQKLYADYLGEPLSEKAHHLLHTEYKPSPLYKD